MDVRSRTHGGYIDKGELEVKLTMCAYLGSRPLFIMRFSPKSYNKMVIDMSGFALLFVMQIYPFGQAGLVGRIRGTLGLPADCPRAIPSGIIDRFVHWHEERVRVNSLSDSQQ